LRFITNPVVLAAGAAIVAVRIGREVEERETVAVDVALLQWIHAATAPWLQLVAEWITSLGSPVATTVVVMLGALVLWRHGRTAAAAVLSAAAVLTAMLVAGLKELFGRARPDLWPHSQPSGESFPSGHAVESAMVYGTLAVLLARRYPQHHAVIGILAAAVVLAIAATRAILGVHWPSDLVAGLAIGVIALMVTVFAIDRCERPRSLEK
jgi:undecaprenyl-diphosphatase